MKKLLTAFTILAVSLFTAPCLMAWVLTRSAHAPRPGDSLGTDLYEGVEPGAPGAGRVWDFSAAVPRDEAYGMRVTGVPDSLVTMRFPRHRMYCSLKGDSLLWHGYETRHILLTDSAGIPYMTYPVAYGDSCARPFCLTGRYALERPAANRGLACVKADASGTLLMPDGDTVRSVLRVCREYRGVPRLGTGALRLAAVDSALSPEIVYREYDWYAPGYRYPLFSLRRPWRSSTAPRWNTARAIPMPARDTPSKLTSRMTRRTRSSGKPSLRPTRRILSRTRIPTLAGTPPAATYRSPSLDPCSLWSSTTPAPPSSWS